MKLGRRGAKRAAQRVQRCLRSVQEPRWTPLALASPQNDTMSCVAHLPAHNRASRRLLLRRRHAAPEPPPPWKRFTEVATKSLQQLKLALAQAHRNGLAHALHLNMG